MKTISAVRQAFWDQHTEFKKEFKKTLRQNDYKTDIRCAFVDFVDHLSREGSITEKLAQRVTL